MITTKKWLLELIDTQSADLRAAAILKDGVEDLLKSIKQPPIIDSESPTYKKNMGNKSNIEKVAEGLGLEVERCSDGSGTWVLLEDDHHCICIEFCGKGQEFTGIVVCKKIYQVVDEKRIAKVGPRSSKHQL
jgi:hypothetical protein